MICIEKEARKKGTTSFRSPGLQAAHTWMCWGLHLGPCRRRDRNAPGNISQQPEQDFASKIFWTWTTSFPCFLSILFCNTKNCVGRHRLCLRNGRPNHV
ncbi:hypothetical protein CPC08DRAFT_391958 [Agrocybe pediades]|nr:hypothetical protein CPC08DRAFT_391958 [Agrocybe pediades]